MATNELKRAEPIPLPATREDMLANWKAKRLPLSVNDAVQECHIALFDPTDPDNQYVQYLKAVWPEEAVTGWIVLDEGEAARVIRNHAKERPGLREVLGDAKLAVIIKALRVVLKRAGLDRKVRSRTVGGEVVPNGDE